MRLVMRTLVMVVLLTLSSAAWAKGKIIFFDLKSQPSTQAVAKRINQSLRSWVDSSGKLSTMHGRSLAHTRLMYCRPAKLKRSFRACLAQIARREGADRLVIGSVLASGTDFRVVLTIFDARAPKKTRSLTERLSGAHARGPALESWISSCFNRLFQPEKGFLVVSCAPEEVSVDVDRVAAGHCGSGVMRFQLEHGRRRLAFGRSGYVTLVQWVKVRGGETTRIKINLRRKSPVRPRLVPRKTPAARDTPAPVPTKAVTPQPAPAGSTPAKRTVWRALFFSTLGTGAALLVSSIFTSLQVRKAEQEKMVEVLLNADAPPADRFDNHDNVCASSTITEALADVCNRQVHWSQTTKVLIGVGASLVVTSGIFLYLGYIARAREKAGARASAPRLRVTPQVLRGGGGVQAELKF